MDPNKNLDNISKLEDQAKQLLELKQSTRPKRPIIIEFSGSPKSGKSSCISSLETFLKRNNFKTKVIKEYAGECPVENKHNPFFNIWTSCRVVSDIIGVLEMPVGSLDVVIVDRGIFDALCWFDYLCQNNHMEKISNEILAKFLLLPELINSIDIVFAFSAVTEVSIEREYANLLTNKHGSVMNQTVLDLYRKSMDEVKKNYSASFKKIESIDTSNDDQNTVGEKVTRITLETLNELLSEKIGYFSKNEQLMDTLSKKEYFDFNELNSKFEKLGLAFNLRRDVEEDANLLQPIPIVVITNPNKDKVLVVKKSDKSTEKGSPEMGKTLLYVGGHTREEDKVDENILTVLKQTLKREVDEELGIALALEDNNPIFIYTTDHEKSQKHIAVCFLHKTDNLENLKLRLDEYELVQTRGSSDSGRIKDVSTLSQESNLDSWSRIILKEIFNQRFDEQISLF